MVSRSEEFAGGAGEHYFHGTSAELSPGDQIVPRRAAGAKHAYFTTDRGTALSYAHAKANQSRGTTPRVYRVKPTGPFEVDPNDWSEDHETDPPIMFRSKHPLQVIE